MPWKVVLETYRYQCRTCGTVMGIGAPLSVVDSRRKCPCGRIMLAVDLPCEHTDVRRLRTAPGGQCRQCGRIVMWEG